MANKMRDQGCEVFSSKYGEKAAELLLETLEVQKWK